MLKVRLISLIRLAYVRRAKKISTSDVDFSKEKTDLYGVLKKCNQLFRIYIKGDYL
jgi:hypothetical protein